MTVSEPFAEVKQIGRFTYRVVVHDGIETWGPGMSGVVIGWTVWGRWRAERKGRKVLARYLRETERRERWEREARRIGINR